MPTERSFAGKTCDAQPATSARCHGIIHAKRARRLFRDDQAEFSCVLLPQYPFLPLLLGNARIAIDTDRSRRSSLHQVGMHAYRTRVGIEKRHFFSDKDFWDKYFADECLLGNHLLGSQYRTASQYGKRKQRGKDASFFWKKPFFWKEYC